MGKWTDKMYMTHSEWVNHYGGKKSQLESNSDVFRKLPFDCCSLSLRPFSTPVCTKDGTLFELVNIIPFLRKFGINPVTGETMKADELIRLHVHKNGNGEYCDPVTFSVFTDHSHIVANKKSGNVYSYDTIERLNIKANYWRDLVNDEVFTRADIVTLQDPHNVKGRNLSEFHHLKNKLKVDDEEATSIESKINMQGTTGRILAELGKSKSISSSVTPSYVKPKTAPFNAAPYSKGKMAASLTSTSMPIVTIQEQAVLDEEEIMFKKIKTNGYVRIKTNFGDLNVELFCDKTPKTAYNFIMLSKQGYYKNTKFHRSVKNFMIQGGDPTGTGKGGESFWKKEFEDEFVPQLSHNARGFLSMANRGKNTNGSQFFFTFRACQHLDRKHTLFGKIVGGLDILSRLEGIETDSQDKPLEDIIITDTVVFVDPFEEFKKKMEKREESSSQSMINFVESVAKVANDSVAVGKYIKSKDDAKSSSEADGNGASQSKKMKGKGFSDFSNW